MTTRNQWLEAEAQRLREAEFARLRELDAARRPRLKRIGPRPALLPPYGRNDRMTNPGPR